jgi:hypothetical protein
VSLDEKNDWTSPGAAASLRMNLEEADMAPELELNEILWQSVRGAGAAMPPPRRTGFIHPLDDGDDAKRAEPARDRADEGHERDEKAGKSETRSKN